MLSKMPAIRVAKDCAACAFVRCVPQRRRCLRANDAIDG